MNKAPGRADQQLTISEQELRTGVLRGAAAWLAEGMKIQESQ